MIDQRPHRRERHRNGEEAPHAKSNSRKLRRWSYSASRCLGLGHLLGGAGGFILSDVGTRIQPLFGGERLVDLAGKLEQAQRRSQRFSSNAA